MQNVKHQVYNDGLAKYGTITPKRNDFNKKIGEDFEIMDCIRFSKVLGSDRDYELASSLGHSLDLKIKVPKNVVKSNYKLSIQDEIYDIYRLEDSDMFSDYLYLERVDFNE